MLALTGWLLSGVTFHGSAWAVIVAAAVFGVLNTILKPILKLITLPFAILTLGIAWFFVSMFTLWLTVLLVPKFDINGFWNYVWATIIIWALNIVVDAIFRLPLRPRPPPPDRDQRRMPASSSAADTSGS